MSADAVKDVTGGSFEGLEIGVGVRAEPLVLDFAPEGLDFVVVALSKPSALKRGRGRGRVATCSSATASRRGWPRSGKIRIRCRKIRPPGRLVPLPAPGRAFGLVGIVRWVLGLFQGVARALLLPATLVKKRRKVRARKSLVSSWRNVAVTFLSCCRLARAAASTCAAAAAKMDRRPCPAALASPASPPRSPRSNQV